MKADAALQEEAATGPAAIRSKAARRKKSGKK